MEQDGYNHYIKTSVGRADRFIQSKWSKLLYNNCYGASTKYCREITLRISLLIAARVTFLRCHVQPGLWSGQLRWGNSLHRLTFKSWLLTEKKRKLVWVKHSVIISQLLQTRLHVMDCLMEGGMCSTNADLCQTVAQSQAVSIQLIWVQIKSHTDLFIVIDSQINSQSDCYATWQ